MAWGRSGALRQTYFSKTLKTPGLSLEGTERVQRGLTMGKSRGDLFVIFSSSGAILVTWREPRRRDRGERRGREGEGEKGGEGRRAPWLGPTLRCGHSCACGRNESAGSVPRAAIALRRSADQAVPGPSQVTSGQVTRPCSLARGPAAYYRRSSLEARQRWTEEHHRDSTQRSLVSLLTLSRYPQNVGTPAGPVSAPASPRLGRTAT